MVRPGGVLHVKESSLSQWLKIIKLSVLALVPLTAWSKVQWNYLYLYSYCLA